MNEVSCILTSHSISRAKERLHKNKKNACTYIKKAVERGRTADSFTSLERVYLEHLQESHSGRKTVIYDRNCFIFSPDGSTCITVFPLPSWFGRKKQFDGKKRIRHSKKYSRNRPCFWEEISATLEKNYCIE